MIIEIGNNLLSLAVECDGQDTNSCTNLHKPLNIELRLSGVCAVPILNSANTTTPLLQGISGKGINPFFGAGSPPPLRSTSLLMLTLFGIRNNPTGPRVLGDRHIPFPWGKVGIKIVGLRKSKTFLPFSTGERDGISVKERRWESK